MSLDLNSLNDLSDISLIIVSFAFLCLILTIIFLSIIAEQICPLFCLWCCPNHCHNKCSSKIHALSDTNYISRKQLSLHIHGHIALNHDHIPVPSTSVNTYTNTSHSTSTQPQPLQLQNNYSSHQLELPKQAPQERPSSPPMFLNISSKSKSNNLSPNNYSPRSEADNAITDHDGYNDIVIEDIDDDNTSFFAKLLVFCCIAYFYWDADILSQYKKKRVHDIKTGTVSKSLGARVLRNISYFGLFMNLILFSQCVCIFILYQFPSYPYSLFINLYYIFHNLWLILCNISLTAILLNILQIVKATNEDQNAKIIKNATSFALISFCGIFIFSTLIFHAFAVILNTIFWDIIGGIVRNLLISILCLILAKNTYSLKKSVSLAFSRVSSCINNIHQINEHKKIINVLVVLFVASIILSILVTVAALQYFIDLFLSETSTANLSMAQQAIPGTYITDILWLFIKLMSSFIILYYAVINVKQRRKVIISIINQQIAMKKDKQRSKRKRSCVSPKQHQTM